MCQHRESNATPIFIAQPSSKQELRDWGKCLKACAYNKDFSFVVVIRPLLSKSLFRRPISPHASPLFIILASLIKRRVLVIWTPQEIKADSKYSLQNCTHSLGFRCDLSCSRGLNVEEKVRTARQETSYIALSLLFADVLAQIRRRFLPIWIKVMIVFTFRG